MKIKSWNDKTQDIEDVEINLNSKVMLGCENQPVVRICNWMEDQGIEDVSKMIVYINNLDFNVQVVK